MNWLDTLKKVSEITKVAVPLVVPGGPIAVGAQLAATAVGLVQAAMKDGQISEAEIAVINQLLIPHGLAVIHLKED